MTFDAQNASTSIDALRHVVPSVRFELFGVVLVRGLNLL